MFDEVNFNDLVWLHAWNKANSAAQKKKIFLNQDLYKESQEELQEYKSLGINCTSYHDPDYPQALKELQDPPLLLYHYGSLAKLSVTKQIAIVGSREASSYGLASTRAIIDQLKTYNLTVVSGLARGIDLQAHQTALDLGLPTIAVLGSGLLNFAYGGRQQEVFEIIKGSPESLLLSEFHPRAHATSISFPIRNRIIAALAFAVIVVEAGQRSGALITADYALELKKPVFCLASDINKENFKGNNFYLAKQKAQAIFAFDHLALQLGLSQQIKLDLGLKPMNSLPNQGPARERILSAVGFEAISFDSLVYKTELDQKTLMKELVFLEISGLIKRESGSTFSRKI